MESLCKYDHGSIFSPTKRLYSFGHAPEGMILYYYMTTLDLLSTEEKTSDLIIARFRNKKTRREFTIVSVFINPNNRYEAFERLNSTFLAHSLDSRKNVIVGGDFNARIGCHSDIPSHLVLSPQISSHRNSVDPTINQAGLKFLDFTAENSLLILNGRAGKNSGNSTFCGNGISVLDYILVNWDNLDSVNYLDVLPLGFSDHFPVALHVKSGTEVESQSSDCRTVIAVPSTEKCTFKAKLLQTPAPTHGPETDVDELNHYFISTLTSAAASIGFTKKKVSRYLNDKPWFDYDCRESMKKLRSLARAISKRKPGDDDSVQELKWERSQFKSLLNEKKCTKKGLKQH